VSQLYRACLILLLDTNKKGCLFWNLYTGCYLVEWYPVDNKMEKHTARIVYLNLTCWDPENASLVYGISPRIDEENGCISCTKPTQNDAVFQAFVGLAWIPNNDTRADLDGELLAHDVGDNADGLIPSTPRSDLSAQHSSKGSSTRVQRRRLARETKKLAKKKQTTVASDRSTATTVTQGRLHHAKSDTECSKGTKAIDKEKLFGASMETKGLETTTAIEPITAADCVSQNSKTSNVLSTTDANDSDGLGDCEPEEKPSSRIAVTTMAEHATPVSVKALLNIPDSAGDRFLRRFQEYSRRPRWAIAKFRCPKDKMPGDTMTVRHPHCEKRFLELVIPSYAKAGKAFNVEIPVLEELTVSTCVLCDEILPEVGDFDEDQRAPLRVCNHICCHHCHDVLSGRFCPACEAPIPCVSTLMLLPLIQQMNNPVPVCEALLEEYFLNQQYHADSKSKEICKKWEVARQNSERVIDQHYRRASIKYHPDRFGDTYRKEFDELRTARDILGDFTLRANYLDPMISIACKVDKRYIPYSHTMWMQNNTPDKKEQAQFEAKTDNHFKKPNLQLEGGLIYSCQRKPMILSALKRNILVCLPIKNDDQFKLYCQKVIIYGMCSNMEAAEVSLATIPNSKFEIVDGEIRVSVNVPLEGMWDLSWNFSVSYDNGMSVYEAPRSTYSRVDVRSKEEKDCPAKVDDLLTIVKELKSKLRQDQGTPLPTGRSQVLRRYNWLHNEIVRSVNLRTKLKAAITDLDDPSYRFIVEVEHLIKSSTEQRNRIETVLKKYDTKASRKEFRRSIAQHLLSDDAKVWISSVSAGELAEKGGDANSMYQLLIESKQTQSTSVDESVLVTAGNRDDLFTDKQRQILKDRVLAAPVVQVDALHHRHSVKEREGIDFMGLTSASFTRDFQHNTNPKQEPQGMGSTVSELGIVGLSSSKTSIHCASQDDLGTRNEKIASSDGRPHCNQDVVAEVTENGSDIVGARQPQSCVQNVVVDFERVGQVVGKNHKNLIQIMKKTGTKIKLSKEKQSIGTVTFLVSSDFPENVNKAATLIEQAASAEVVSDSIPSSESIVGSASTPKDGRLASTWNSISNDNIPSLADGDTIIGTILEASSILSTLTGDDDLLMGAVRASIAPPPGFAMIGGIPFLDGIVWNTPDELLLPLVGHTTSSVSPVTLPSTSPTSFSTSSTLEREGLLDLLIDQADCFKVSPSEFLDWLANQDILCLSDLKHACDDEDFLSVEMREAGLKRFKKNAFVKAVSLWSH
jgi:hypothetical protein